MGLNEDLERIALQERELVLPRLDAEMAWELGSRLRTMAAERGLAVVIDVRRFGAAALLCGDGRHHARQCRMGAAQEQRGRSLPSQFLRRRLERKSKNETLLETKACPLADYATHGGSFPLAVPAQALSAA